MKSESE
jgi:hypothetical protein